ncbi:MAG TPA: hypothetical protein VM432_11275 [Bdellovibrionales bacterium]|nr:hypothetical protein [Bdellovibrionales bacterium]
MKQLIAMAMVVTAFGQAQAQTQTAVVVPVAPQAAPIVTQAPQKRTVIYDERTNQLVEVSPQVKTTSEASAAAPIYILNGGAQVQEQPTMVVQDSPLNNSPAEGARKSRQDAESATEDGIVQALEKARMEDELRRRDKFNSAIAGTPTPTPTPAPAPVVVAPVAPIQEVTVVPAPVAAPQAVVEAPKAEKEEENVDIKAEIRAALAETEAKKPEEPKAEYYVGGLVGIGTYHGIGNIKSNGAAGFSVGMASPQGIVVDGSFLYGNYELEDQYQTRGYWEPYIVDMTQMNIGAAVKYQLPLGKVRPAAGPAISYTRRAYDDDGIEVKTTNSVDLGLASSLDVAVTSNFAIGVDFKYYWNMTSSSSNSYERESIIDSDSNDPEDLNYYQLGLAAKILF